MRLPEHLKKLEGYGYIDDSEYAAEYVKSAISSGKSRRAAEYKLKEKGVSPAVISAAMKEYTEETEVKAAENSVAAMRRAKKNDKQIYAALSRRGFSYGIINSLIKEDE